MVATLACILSKISLDCCDNMPLAFHNWFSSSRSFLSHSHPSNLHMRLYLGLSNVWKSQLSSFLALLPCMTLSPKHSRTHSNCGCMLALMLFMRLFGPSLFTSPSPIIDPVSTIGFSIPWIRKESMEDVYAIVSVPCVIIYQEYLFGSSISIFLILFANIFHLSGVKSELSILYADSISSMFAYDCNISFVFCIIDFVLFLTCLTLFSSSWKSVPQVVNILIFFIAKIMRI